MSQWIIETERVGLRNIQQDDRDGIKKILQDEEVMYAWEHGFSEQEVDRWMAENLKRYGNEGYSYLTVIEKSQQQLIGMMGPLIERINGREHIGIAYILDKNYWGYGYATEGAIGCVQYAFDVLGAQSVIAEIRPENEASCKVAQRLGMKVTGQFSKHYQGKDMVHLIYSVDKEDWQVGEK